MGIAESICLHKALEAENGLLQVSQNGNGHGPPCKRIKIAFGCIRLWTPSHRAEGHTGSTDNDLPPRVPLLSRSCQCTQVQPALLVVLYRRMGIRPERVTGSPCSCEWRMADVPFRAPRTDRPSAILPFRIRLGICTRLHVPPLAKKQRMCTARETLAS